MAEPTMPAVEGQTASETQQNTSNESDEQPTLTTTAGPVPTPSPLPPQSDESGSEESDWEQVGSDQGEDETVPLPPKEPPVYPNPGYVWINLDESEETSNLFRDAVPEGRDASLWFEELSNSVVRMLYPTLSRAKFPGDRQAVMLYTESMKGVAYTTSSEQGTESEIHLSTRYLRDVKKDRGMEGVKSEVHGVLVHELVHVWQQSSLHNIPGGLIEGIADYVRLLHGLAPPHWQKERSRDWLAGYQTTGYFLAWIEERYPGFVERLNAYCGSNGEWSEDCIWWLVGKPVDELWAEYQASIPTPTDEAPKGQTIPTHVPTPTEAAS